MTVYSLLAILTAAFMTPLSIIAAVSWSFFDHTGNGPHRVARLWARTIILASRVRVEVRGRELIDPQGTYVFAANHTSVMDILVLLAYLPIQFRWLAKEELFRIPFFGLAMRRCGYIPINRRSPREGVRSLKRAAERIRAGASVIIFPEGTRSKDGRVLDFKRGGFTLAVQSGQPIVPLSISGAWRAMAAKSLRINAGPIRIVLGRPHLTKGLDREAQDRLVEEVRAVVVANVDPELGK